MKYISMDDIVDICQANIPPLKANRQGVAVSALRRVIEAAQEYAVEAEPVKHGKWERHTNFAGNYYTCTVCKNVAREMSECMGEPVYEFCPYCGARMDGGAD